MSQNITFTGTFEFCLQVFDVVIVWLWLAVCCTCVQGRMLRARKKWPSNWNVSRQSIHNSILKARFTRLCRVEVGYVSNNSDISVPKTCLQKRLCLPLDMTNSTEKLNVVMFYENAGNACLIQKVFDVVMDSKTDGFTC